LETIEVWNTKRIYLAWKIVQQNPDPRESYPESDSYDDGLESFTLQEPLGLKVYLKMPRLSRNLPLELAEQIANFCCIPDRISLVNVILNEEDACIKMALDRRNIPEAPNLSTNPDTACREESTESITENQNVAKEVTEDEKPQPLKRLGTEVWVGSGPSSSHFEYVANNKSAESDDGLDSQSIQETSPNPRVGRRASASSHRHDSGLATPLAASGSPTTPSRPIRTKPPSDSVAPPAPIKSIPLSPIVTPRPNYVPIDNAPTIVDPPPVFPVQSKRKRRAHGGRDNRSMARFEKPSIVSSKLVFVQDPEELPAETPSSEVSHKNMITYQGRAQISTSGDCTIIVAVQPTGKINSDIEFLGELFVS
jgi:hypothetical protein